MSTIIDEQAQSPPAAPVTAGFIVTVLYLIIEYGRPQDHIALIGAMRPNLILMLLLVILLFNSWSRLQTAASAQSSRMLMMLFLLALHVPFAVNNGRAFHEAQSFLMYVVMFASIIVFVDTLDKLRLFLKCWIYLMIYVAINGIVGGGSAGSSFLQDNNDFALLMNAMLPFGVFLFLYEQQKKTKLFYLTASVLVVASVVVTVSRGGFVGLVTVMFVIWLTSSRKLVTLTLACFLVLGIYLFADPVYWERISTIKTAQDYNAASRLELWDAAWEMFKDHPFGVGPGNYPVHLPDYQSEFFGDKNMWGKAAHSVWFTLLSELGIPGVVLYLSLLRANVRDLRYLKNLPPDDEIHRFAHFLALAFMASLAGFFASGTFLSALYYPHYWFLTGMIVATRKVIDRAVASGVVDPDRQVAFGKA